MGPQSRPVEFSRSLALLGPSPSVHVSPKGDPYSGDLSVALGLAHFLRGERHDRLPWMPKAALQGFCPQAGPLSCSIGEPRAQGRVTDRGEVVAVWVTEVSRCTGLRLLGRARVFPPLGEF